jgi:hypothetical protein
VGALVVGLVAGDAALVGRSIEDLIVEPARARLIPGFAAVKRAALRVQGELERFDFLELVPHHFLHVTVPAGAVRRFNAPIDLEYARVNCFHTAVVAEVRSPALRALDPTPTFLPHMTLAVVRRPAPSPELRRVLEPLREGVFGVQRVDEILRVHVEFSRERGLQPWTIVDRI